MHSVQQQQPLIRCELNANSVISAWTVFKIRVIRVHQRSSRRRNDLECLRSYLLLGILLDKAQILKYSNITLQTCQGFPCLAIVVSTRHRKNPLLRKALRASNQLLGNIHATKTASTIHVLHENRATTVQRNDLVQGSHSRVSSDSHQQ